MKIVKGWPPNIEEIKKHFDFTGKTVAFAYGDTIFNPFEVEIKDDQIHHEEVHSRQQSEVGGPEIWWEIYFTDTKQRIEWEVEAYGAQLKYIREREGTAKEAAWLPVFAGFLSGPVYGNAIDFNTAKERILNASL